MKPQRADADGSRADGQPQLFREWIGGRFPTPFFVQDREEPYRPDVVLWLELPGGLIVGQAVVTPEDTGGAVARTLRSALTQPLVGAPRRPDLIRVADDAAAAEVRAEVAGTIPVNVAPTPELDELLDHMIATMPASPEDEPSYFAGGRVPPAAVEKLFTACLPLFAMKPWTVASDLQVIRPEPDDDSAPFALSAPAEPFRPRAGRNDPCPCGSGRKYKKCHLAADEAEHAQASSATATHGLDERVVSITTPFSLPPQVA